MPDALVSTTELAIHNDWPADTYPQDRALQAVWAATAMIQAATGQRIAAVANDPALIYLGSRTVWLPQRPVTGLTQIAVIGGSTYTNGGGVDWTLFGNELTVGTWLLTPTYATVTYSHGYATIPEQIKWVCCAAATRLLDNPGALFSATSGGEGVVFARGDVAGPGLLPAEHAALDPWCESMVA